MPGRDVFVLSGGAARGAVQVGMAEVLLAAGIAPTALVGTSVGALNAAFLAAGPTLSRVGELREHWLGLSARDVFPGSHWTRLGHLVLHPTSLYSSAGLLKLIREWTPVDRLEDLVVPLRVTTTQLATGRAVYHRSGDLARVLLASTALPAIFDPVSLTDPVSGLASAHVDGGVADLVPIAGAADLAPTRVFVLDASVPVRERRTRTPLDVLLASLAVAMRVRPEVRLGDDVEVHHLSTPDLGTRMNDFSHTAEHIELGRDAARAVLGQVSLAA